jgi:hypothetical protein
MNDTSMESHIKTLETHRKKGLATRTLAEKFGYEKVFEYYLYEFNL